MQTALPHSPRLAAAARRAASAAAAALLALGLGGCSGLRVEGRAESQIESSPCETAYYAAQDHTDAAGDGTALTVQRYIAAEQAAHDWLDVAIQCPQRFSEGTLRSAQMQYSAMTLAAKLGQSYQPLTVRRLDGIDSMAISGTSLAQMALAEDRAGFITEVLAGKYVVKAPSTSVAACSSSSSGSSSSSSGTESSSSSSCVTAASGKFVAALASNGASKLLGFSDDHKEAASQMMSIAGSGTEDLRRKVYATDDILADPYTIVDPVTGAKANTVAVAEINAARAELTAMESAFDGASSASSSAASSGSDSSGSASSSASSGSASSGSASSAASSDTASSGSDASREDSSSSGTASSHDTASSAWGNASSSSANEALKNDLLQISMLIATHAYTAFTLGYPSTDHYLFQQE